MSAWSVEILCPKCGSAVCAIAQACALEEIRKTAFRFYRSWNDDFYAQLSEQVREAVDSGRFGTAQVADAVNKGLKDAEKWEAKRFSRAACRLSGGEEG